MPEESLISLGVGDPQRYSNIIVGGGISGCITAWILANQGYSARLLEKSADPYGANGSFQDELGNWFDYGKHCLEYNRSEFTTNFFREVQDGNVRKFEFKRAIVLRGHVIPYAAPLEEWPSELADNVEYRPEKGPLRLGSSRKEIADVFGSWFSDLIFDEALESYPTLSWRREHGEKEEKLLNWIYPWFFPLTEAEAEPRPEKEKGIHHIESRSYHHRTRHAHEPEHALYPEENGFENWLSSTLLEARSHVDVMLDVDDIDVRFDNENNELTAVEGNGSRFRANRYFWCAPASVLAGKLELPLPDGVPQVGLLGSYVFEHPINPKYHEILLADPDHRMYRISFPHYIQGKEECHTIQVEFLHPKGEFEKEPEEWRKDWLNSLRRLELISDRNKHKSFEFKQVPRGFVTTEDINTFTQRCREALAPYDNVIAPYLSASPDNTSRTVPTIFKNVYATLTSD